MKVLILALVVSLTSIASAEENAGPGSIESSKKQNTPAAESPASEFSGHDAISSSAAAPSATTAGQSLTDLKTSISGSWTDKFSLRDDGIFYGPSVEGWGSTQPSPGTETSSFPIFIRNSLGMTYKINPEKLVVGATFSSDMFPNGQNYNLANTTSTEITNHYMAVNDSYVRVMAPKLINNGGFTLLGDLRLYAPLSYASRDLTGMGYSIRTQFIPNYQFGTSRWSAGAIIRQTTYVSHYNWADGDAGSMVIDAYMGPMVNYQLMPKVSVGVFVEFEAESYVGQGALHFTTTNPGNPTPWDVEPNLSWDITPNVNLNPFLQFYPSGRVALEETSFGMLFGAKFF